MIDSMQPTVDRIVRLLDGRSVSYALYGSQDGFPIVNAHGGLACRLDVAAADSVATAAGDHRGRAAQWFRNMGLAARTAPTLYGRLAARELGPADGAVLRRDGFAMFARMTSAAFMAPCTTARSSTR